ncbi:selenide, water dikinase SelD [Rhodocyclus purpureus]|uniref:selenide, water dikinase SelD n=1 Tax=Rhodocyclus purpureus TaxID=1067 RepID=UPI001911BEB3|nr:selenide, water dikinase SelD [Rhodocyclus purpureus]MBK5915169.1 selenide, water dikinase SelD [Rhodocyclus purpureus]
MNDKTAESAARPAATTDAEPVRLTRFSHGGGCGCKIAPAVLSRLLAESPLRVLPPDLLVGTETSDDAAVYRVNDEQAIVATTDFFTPIVDDPYDFGRIAATNALSDVYAMGGKPLFALALVGMPLDKLPEDAIRRILAGGEAVCAAAGIPIAGGHSIDVLEPIYGLVGIGLVHPQRVRRNSSARAGDVLILSKPLGIGVLSAALKKGILSTDGYGEMIKWTTTLNTPGTALAGFDEVHALTDVTGFGLGGHLLEICRGSGLAARVDFAALPLIAEALAHSRNGVVTGATGRNWAAYGAEVVLPDGSPDWQRTLITDPQTSGGLLIACAESGAARVLELLHGEGFAEAVVIGRLESGTPRLIVG